MHIDNFDQYLSKRKIYMYLASFFSCVSISFILHSFFHLLRLTFVWLTSFGLSHWQFVRVDTELQQQLHEKLDSINICFVRLLSQFATLTGQHTLFLYLYLCPRPVIMTNWFSCATRRSYAGFCVCVCVYMCLLCRLKLLLVHCHMINGLFGCLRVHMWMLHKFCKIYYITFVLQFFCNLHMHIHLNEARDGLHIVSANTNKCKYVQRLLFSIK